MRREAKIAALATALLASGQGYQSWVQLHDAPYLTVLTGAAAVLGLLAAARLWWSNCMESRLLSAALAICALAGNLIVATIGLPGAGQPTAPTTSSVLIVVLSGVTLLALMYSNERRACPTGAPQNNSARVRV